MNVRSTLLKRQATENRTYDCTADTDYFYSLNIINISTIFLS